MKSSPIQMQVGTEEKKVLLLKGRLLYRIAPQIAGVLPCTDRFGMAVPSWASHGKEEIDMFEK